MTGVSEGVSGQSGEPWIYNLCMNLCRSVFGSSKALEWLFRRRDAPRVGSAAASIGAGALADHPADYAHRRMANDLDVVSKST